MRLVNTLFVPIVIGLTAISLAGDRAAYNPVRLVRSLLRLRDSPFLTRDMLDHVRAYHRPGFHPDDFDATELLDRWKAELFGTDGSLTDTSSTGTLTAGASHPPTGAFGPGVELAWVLEARMPPDAILTPYERRCWKQLQRSSRPATSDERARPGVPWPCSWRLAWPCRCWPPRRSAGRWRWPPWWRTCA